MIRLGGPITIRPEYRDAGEGPNMKGIEMFAIYFRGNDRHDPMNGQHKPCASVAEFIATYPDCEPEEGGIDDTARLLSEMTEGETLRFWLESGDLDVTRV